MRGAMTITLVLAAAAFGAPAPLPRAAKQKPILPLECVTCWNGMPYPTRFGRDGSYRAGDWVGIWTIEDGRTLVVRERYSGAGEWHEYRVALSPCRRHGTFGTNGEFTLREPGEALLAYPGSPGEVGPPPAEEP